MSSNHESDYKPLYKSMKRKLKILIYENECFQEELRKAQRSLLRVERDKSFLLDRIMQYQQGPESSSDSEQTDDSESETVPKDNKRRKLTTDTSVTLGSVGALQGSSGSKGSVSNVKKKKSSSSGSSKPSHGSMNCKPNSNSKQNSTLSGKTQKSRGGLALGNAAVTSLASPLSLAEIERHLAARPPAPLADFPPAVSLTLPNQLFSEHLDGTSDPPDDDFDAGASPDTFE